MTVSKALAVHRTKQRAAAALEAVAADMDTLQAESRAVLARYTELEVQYLAIERRAQIAETMERHLRQRIAELEQPWYVRWFGLGESR